jgi:hypothetical protein
MGGRHDHLLTAAKELSKTSGETLDNMGQFVDILKDTRNLYAVDSDTGHSPMLSLGLTLLLVPDPITTPLGAGMLLFGAVQEKIIGPPLYIKDIYQEFNQDVLDLMKGIESISTPELPVELKTLEIAPRDITDKARKLASG